MKSLIIAEKPSVAADLARSFGKIPKKGDHYENDTHVISYALGHVVELEHGKPLHDAIDDGGRIGGGHGGALVQNPRFIGIIGTLGVFHVSILSVSFETVKCAGTKKAGRKRPALK